MGANIIGSGKCPVCNGMWAVLGGDPMRMRRHKARRIEHMNPDWSCKGTGEEPTEFVARVE